MIVSASRRTDIPALYAPWLMARLKEGFTLVEDSYRADRLYRVRLSPEEVDCIVFWSKNPAPMLPYLDALQQMGYIFYFQFTLNAYGDILEPNLPPLEKRIETFRALSCAIGAERVVWRYDPIVFCGAYTPAWHTERFSLLCTALEGAAQRCVFSFYDAYRHLPIWMRRPEPAQMLEMAQAFSLSARQHGITLSTCAEQIDLTRFSIGHGACIDAQFIEKLIGCKLRRKKDSGQRKACRCLPSVDIGAYNTCVHGCAYCYAVKNRAAAMRAHCAHDMCSPVLSAVPWQDKIVVDRKDVTLREEQLSLAEWK